MFQRSSTTQAFTPGDKLPTHPIAKKIPKVDTQHGDKRVDNYFWLREKSNPKVISYLEEENKYTDKVMSSSKSLEEKLYKEMIGRIDETDSEVPYKKGNFYYYYRTEPGKQYRIYCRKEDSLKAPEEIILDLNVLAKDLKFLGLKVFKVSDDGNFLAYSIDTTGFRQYILYVKNLRTGKLLSDRVERTDTISWASDNKTLFLVTEDAVTKRSNKLYCHTIDNNNDELIYEEKSEQFNLYVDRANDKKYTFIISESSNTSEVRYIPCETPLENPKVILSREENHRYYVDHYKDFFYIRTNYQAKNFHIVSTPIDKTSKDNWKDFVQYRKDIKIENMKFFEGYCVVTELQEGISRFLAIDLKTSHQHLVTLPESVYAIEPINNVEFKTAKFRFTYESLTTPKSVIDYDFTTHQTSILKEAKIPSGYDKNQYKSERIYATASDGTKVPISIVYKKNNFHKDGKSPALLYGYGSYGISMTVNFSAERLSLLDRGIVYAIAHIRGGGDLGEEWYEHGKLMEKRNTFTDFISCAEYLITEKYTSKEKLAIQGGSAGGLLMGAVTNMRPDLFSVVVSQVPFVDVMNTMLDASLPLTTQEYLEWGNPNELEAYNYMKSYCPYTNLAAKAYPHILVITSLNDSQVMYWEPAKYVAKLRSLKTDNNVLLFKANMKAGHGGASGRYDSLKERAFMYSFILKYLGINS